MRAPGDVRPANVEKEGRLAADPRRRKEIPIWNRQWRWNRGDQKRTEGAFLVRHPNGSAR